MSTTALGGTARAQSVHSLNESARAGAVVWTGRVISGVVSLFLLIDGGLRVAHFAPYVEGLTQFGYSPALATPIGLTLLVATILYLVPRTAVLGAVLVTGYLGGAAASHVRIGDPWYLFAVALGVLAWGGLYLRDARVRALLPLR
jgi:hypothetical protein